MARTVSVVDNPTSAGTSSVSWPANTSTSGPATAAATTASTWPPDSSPARQAAAVTGSDPSRRATSSLVRSAAGEPGPVPEPGGHRCRPLAIPETGRVEGGDRLGELGVEPVPQGEDLGQGVTVDGDLQPVDRLAQPFEHP